MKILVTGARGQCGRAFVRLAKGRHEVVPTSRRGDDGVRSLDVRNETEVLRIVEETRPDWILHAGAKTDVDGCEREPEDAARVNAEGTANLARAAALLGCRLAYVSTDYVFEGTKGGYGEGDPARPVNAYGRSKLEGERLAREAGPRLLVVRTSVLYAAGHRNFATWILEALRARRPVPVAVDQRASPTWAEDLARQLLALLEADAQGTFHAAGATAASRFEFAEALASAHGLERRLLLPTPASKLPWTARRPLDSSLDVRKVARLATPLPLAAAIEGFREAAGGRA